MSARGQAGKSPARVAKVKGHAVRIEANIDSRIKQEACKLVKAHPDTPNETTLAALEEARTKKLKSAKSIKELRVAIHVKYRENMLKNGFKCIQKWVFDIENTSIQEKIKNDLAYYKITHEEKK